MVFILIVVALILVVLYIILKELEVIQKKMGIPNEKNSLYPVFSEKDIYLAHQELEWKFRNFEASVNKQTTEENKKTHNRNCSEWELADLEYKFMIQSNIDALNGKKTIREIEEEYVHKFDNLRKTQDNREEFIKAIDKYYKQM